MLVSSDDKGRDPFESGENQGAIANLVAGAVHTHRQPQEEESNRKRPRYPTEDKRSKITLGLDSETCADLRRITQEMGVGKQVTLISQALIDYALKAYKSGHIVLKPQVGPGGVYFEATESNGSEN